MSYIIHRKTEINWKKKKTYNKKLIFGMVGFIILLLVGYQIYAPGSLKENKYDVVSLTLSTGENEEVLIEENNFSIPEVIEEIKDNFSKDEITGDSVFAVPDEPVEVVDVEILPEEEVLEEVTEEIEIVHVPGSDDISEDDTIELIIEEEEVLEETQLKENVLEENQEEIPFVTENVEKTFAVRAGDTQSTLMGLQGKVTDSTGTALTSGDVDVTISTSNSCSSNLVFDHEYPNNITSAGLFDITLGKNWDLNLSYNNEYYLCVFVNDEQIGGPYEFRGGQGMIGSEDITDETITSDDIANVSCSKITGNATDLCTITSSGGSMDYTNVAMVNESNTFSEQQNFGGGSETYFNSSGSLIIDQNDHIIFEDIRNSIYTAGDNDLKIVTKRDLVLEPAEKDVYVDGNLTADALMGDLDCSNITGATSDLCTITASSGMDYTNLAMINESNVFSKPQTISNYDGPGSPGLTIISDLNENSKRIVINDTDEGNNYVIQGHSGFEFLVDEIRRLLIHKDTGDVSVTNNLTAYAFFGSGEGLTNLSAGMDYTNVAMTNGSNTFTGDQIFNNDVGIGTANPNTELEVDGDIRLDSILEFSVKTGTNPPANDRVRIRPNNTDSFIALQGAYSSTMGGYVAVFGDNRSGNFGGNVQLGVPKSTSNISFYGGTPIPSEIVHVTSYGHMGIGENVPLFSIHSNGTVKADKLYGDLDCSNITGATSDLCTITDSGMDYTNVAMTNSSNSFSVDQYFQKDILFSRGSTGVINVSSVPETQGKNLLIAAGGATSFVGNGYGGDIYLDGGKGDGVPSGYPGDILIGVIQESKVGIGTDSPTARLNVSGDVGATGTICDSNGCSDDWSGAGMDYTNLVLYNQSKYNNTIDQRIDLKDQNYDSTNIAFVNESNIFTEKQTVGDKLIVVGNLNITKGNKLYFNTPKGAASSINISKSVTGFPGGNLLLAGGEGGGGEGYPGGDVYIDGGPGTGGLPPGNVYLTSINEANVGIGVDSPTARLNISGDVGATGTICDSNGCSDEWNSAGMDYTNVAMVNESNLFALGQTIEGDLTVENIVANKNITANALMGDLHCSNITGATSNLCTITASSGMDYTNVVMVNETNNFSEIQNINNALNVEGQTYIRSGSFPVGYFERETSSSSGDLDSLSGVASGYLLKTTSSSATISEGFGGGLVFSTADSSTAAGNGNLIGRIYARKDGTGSDVFGLLQFWTYGDDGNSPRMTIRKNGEVGIGTSEPGVKLNVSGKIYSNDTICDSNGCIGDGGAGMDYTNVAMVNESNIFNVNQTINANLSVTGNVTANTFIGNINCEDIIGGSDADFCSDSASAGGDSKEASDLYLYNDTTSIYFNKTSLNGTIDHKISEISAGGMDYTNVAMQNQSNIFSDNQYLNGDLVLDNTLNITQRAGDIFILNNKSNEDIIFSVNDGNVIKNHAITIDSSQGGWIAINDDGANSPLTINQTLDSSAIYIKAAQDINDEYAEINMDNGGDLNLKSSEGKIEIRPGETGYVDIFQTESPYGFLMRGNTTGYVGQAVSATGDYQLSLGSSADDFEFFGENFGSQVMTLHGDTGNLDVEGNVTANVYYGDGQGLTNLVGERYDDSLVLFMDFENMNSSLDPRDLSNEKNHGIFLSNSSQIVTASFVGEGSALFGTGGAANQGVFIPDDSSLEGMTGITLMGWFKRQSDTNGNAMLISKFWDGANRAYSMWSDEDTGNDFRCRISTNSQNDNDEADTDTSVVNNVWYHVVCTWDANSDTITMYVNGKQDGNTQAQAGDTVRTNTAPAMIGNDYYAGSYDNKWNGWADNVKIYNRALTEEEINAIYEREHGGRATFNSNLTVSDSYTFGDGGYMYDNGSAVIIGHL